MSWLRAVLGLSTRPGAKAPASCRTRTMPEVGVDRHPGELGAEGQQPVRGVQRRRVPAADGLGVVHEVTLHQAAVGLAGAGIAGAASSGRRSPRPGPGRRRAAATGVADRQRDQLVAHGDGSVVHGGADHHRAVRAHRASRRSAGRCRRTRTARSPRSMPSPSAATWVITVDIPVPNSCVEVCTTAVPSAYMCARARWVRMKNATGYAGGRHPGADQPVPVTLASAAAGRAPPSRIARAPRSRHSRRP